VKPGITQRNDTEVQVENCGLARGW